MMKWKTLRELRQIHGGTRPPQDDQVSIPIIDLKDLLSSTGPYNPDPDHYPIGD